MIETAEVKGLWRAVGESPADSFPRLVLADALEATGEPVQAEALRWAAGKGLSPHDYDERVREKRGSRCRWWSRVDSRMVDSDDLPEEVFQFLSGGDKEEPSFSGKIQVARYPSFEAAWRDFGQAYAAARRAGWEPGEIP